MQSESRAIRSSSRATFRSFLKSDAIGSRKVFWIATLAAIGIAYIFFFSGYQDLIYDAWGYYKLSQNLAKGGLLAAAHESRTYGYPLFVAICSAFQELDTKTVRLLVFHVQLAAVLAACAAAARRLGRAFGEKPLATLLYASAVLNPFLLVHATETLSDALSAALVFLAVALAAAKGGEERSVSLSSAMALLCASFAVVVRPANTGVLFAVVLILAARRILWSDLKLRPAPLLLVAALLPFVPQIWINARVYGRFEPLVVSHLYRDQTRWGAAQLKYGTLIEPGRPPELIYGNPLWRGEDSPAEFFRRRPVSYLATLGLHFFAMLDHDLPFVYATDARPWYRWPLSSLNYVFLFMSLAGMIAVVGRARRRGARDPAAFAALSLLLAAACSAAVYLPTAVESRFSLSFDLLVTPFFAAALLRARELAAERRWKTLGRLGALGAVFMALCVALSAWISAQAPRL